MEKTSPLSTEKASNELQLDLDLLEKLKEPHKENLEGHSQTQICLNPYQQWLDTDVQTALCLFQRWLLLWTVVVHHQLMIYFEAGDLFYFIFNTLCELSIYQCHCKRRPPRWLFINSVQSDSAVGVWLFKVLSGTVWALAAKERLDGVISHNTVLNLVERLNVLQKAR